MPHGRKRKHSFSNPSFISSFIVLLLALPSSCLAKQEGKTCSMCACIFVCLCMSMSVCLSKIKINSFTSNYVHYSRNTKFTISLFDYGLSIELNIYLDWMYLFYRLWYYSNWITDWGLISDCVSRPAWLSFP